MGDIVLHELSAAQDGRQLEVSMLWEIDRATAREYKTSVRLTNARGDTIASQDRLPLYGFLPTTAWEQGGQVLDRRWLDLPDDVASRGDYTVEVVVYEEVDPDQALGSGTIDGVTIEAPEPRSTGVAGVRVGRRRTGARRPTATRTDLRLASTVIVLSYCPR